MHLCDIISGPETFKGRRVFIPCVKLIPSCLSNFSAKTFLSTWLTVWPSIRAKAKHSIGLDCIYLKRSSHMGHGTFLGKAFWRYTRANIKYCIISVRLIVQRVYVYECMLRSPMISLWEFLILLLIATKWRNINLS